MNDLRSLLMKHSVSLNIQRATQHLAQPGKQNIAISLVIHMVSQHQLIITQYWSISRLLRVRITPPGPHSKLLVIFVIAVAFIMAACTTSPCAALCEAPLAG
jgi:hypothetical protein